MKCGIKFNHPFQVMMININGSDSKYLLLQLMDTFEQPVQQRTLAEERKDLTPGEDDLDPERCCSDQEISLEEQKSNEDHKSFHKDNRSHLLQQRWQDTPNLQEGQSATLDPLAEEQLSEEKKQFKGGEKLQQINAQQKIHYKPISKQLNEQRDFKVFGLYVDSRYIYAAYYLLRDDFKRLINPQDGFIKINPFINGKQILICYYDQNKKDQISEKVQNCLDQLQVIEMSKVDAESGMQSSYKFYQNYLKQNVTYFKDRTQNFKTASYYICGKVNNRKILFQKLNQMKKTYFNSLHLKRYPNTRSYRAILRKIFDTEQIRQFLLQKFRCRQIQIAYRAKDGQLYMNTTKNDYGVFVVLTIQGQKKVPIHQQIQHNLSIFIQKTFAVFCFPFKRKKQYFQNKFTPKVDKVTWFFIAQRHLTTPISYLYIIVKKKDFQTVKQTIIKQIDCMKLDIFGRRFFKNISPQRIEQYQKSKYWLNPYPKSCPYSWTIRAKKDVKFNWKDQLKVE